MSHIASTLVLPAVGAAAITAEASNSTLKTKLRAEGISVTFNRDGNTVEVLKNVDLEASEGEFVCLLGPSGCGNPHF